MDLLELVGHLAELLRAHLGAQPGQVVALVMGSGLKLVAIGLVAGLTAAAGVTNQVGLVLRRSPAGLQVALKRVDLLNCDAPHRAIAVPF